MNDSAAPSTSTALPDGARAVLDFWFGAPGSAEAGQYRKAWFIKDAAFDAQILGRFAPLLEAALAGGLAGWSAAGPEGRWRASCCWTSSPATAIAARPAPLPATRRPWRKP